MNMLRDKTSAAGDETQSLPLIARAQYKSTMIKDLKTLIVLLEMQQDVMTHKVQFIQAVLHKLDVQE